MSAINSIGQTLFQQYKGGKAVQGFESRQAGETQSDNGGSPSPQDQTDVFGAALLMTLQHFGINPHDFQQQFLIAFRTASGKPAVGATVPVTHLNAVA